MKISFIFPFKDYFESILNSKKRELMNSCSQSRTRNPFPGPGRKQKTSEF